MDKIKIAVIDSGIAEEIQDSRIVYKKQFIRDHLDDMVRINSNTMDYNGHGTMVVETILNICPMAEIYVLKVLGIAGTTSEKMLMEAMKHAQKCNVHMVVLAASIVGSKECFGFEEICNQLKKDSKVLIATVQNGKDRSVIANYDNVIGVLGSETLNLPYFFNKQQEIQMICDSKPIIVRGRKGIRQVFKGNSKATAVAAGVIANTLLQNGMQVDKVLECMETESMRIKDAYLQGTKMGLKKNLFEAEIEENYACHDIVYQKFIYLLCEFLKCNDVLEIRRSNLLSYENGKWIKDIDAFFDLIEERIGVKVSFVEAYDLTWAYYFYGKYIKTKGDEEDEEGFKI